ncbi:MAG: AEC family transporter [Gemmiger sp.]|uniref:AEC family transporter n=1 Tax=Gemmiger sp. TaxID=2049027 RepID=UPI002E775F49|nr:AEC family transporter [Gemmiger sp.]MEE0801697.1 AEC family transporter [Gemmiger sp.]
MDNLIFSLNSTLPIFLLMVVGWGLGQIGFLPRSFCDTADKLVFRVTLPVMLFCDMGSVDLTHDFDWRFVLYCAAATAVAILVIWALARRFLPDRSLTGEFVQASYRSSAAILGVAFIQNMYGTSGMAPLMILGSVPLFNIFAVVILTLESPAQQGKIRLGDLLRRVLSNPILLGIVFGTLYSLLPFRLPTLVQKTLTSLSGLTTPLALLSIGAAFEGTRAIQKLAPTLAASACKLVILTGIFLPLAIRIGFRDQQLVALLIMLGSPTTPSAYVMARNMGHEGVLTASTVAATTLLSALTVTGWIFLLRSGGYIV